jgi:hypothetical protein
MQHSVPGPSSGKPIAIAVDGEPLGVVVPSPQGFRFLAVRYSAFSIDGQTFDSIADAETAARVALGASEPLR